MGGGGESAPVVVQDETKAQKIYRDRATQQSNPFLASLLTDYGMGKTSLQDALATVRDKNATAKTDYDSRRNAVIQGARDRASAEWMDRVGRQPLAGNGLPPTGRSAMIRSPEEQAADLEARKKADLEGGYAQRFVDDALRGFDSQNKLETFDENAFMQQITTDPSSAQRYMTDELRSNPLTKGLLGEGGLLDQNTSAYSESLATALGKNGLDTNDRELYGQLSGDIARLYGSQEQSLAQSLADRGLASAPNGAAAVQFSGLQGNKMEQLAKAQQSVAQQRVDNAFRNAQMTGNMSLQLGNFGQNAMSNLYNRNLSGRQQSMSELASSAGQDLAQQQAQQQALNTQFEQIQSTKGPGFGEILGAGLTGAFGAATGGLGAAVGAGIGDKLFGKKKPDDTPGTGGAGFTGTYDSKYFGKL